MIPSAAVVAGGVLAAGDLEPIADYPLVGRRRQPCCAMEEWDRRGPRASGLGRGAAVAEARPVPSGSSPRLWAWAVNCRQSVSQLRAQVAPTMSLRTVVMPRATVGEAEGATSDPIFNWSRRK